MSAAGAVAAGASPLAGYTHGRKMLIFGIMAFGQFMALLDTQIVAASLNSIQAGLSAGPDEIAWVQTAYLMAEIVMIPLAAFLSQALSTRWLFTASAVLFTLTSLLCGFASSSSEVTRSRISRAALLVNVTARTWPGKARPVSRICAKRVVSTRVLPVPAPASTKSGPSMVSTAARCSALRRAR